MKSRPVITRDQWGVPHVVAQDESSFYWGLGRCHAQDRGMQMLLMRILGRGEASACLESSEQMLKIDSFFRRMNWREEPGQAAAKLTPRAREACSAYCDGVNSIFSKRIPWELRLLGYHATPWTMSDSLLISRMVGYVSLAQAQADVERLFIEMVQGGIRRELLEELFPGNLAELDVDLLKKVKLRDRVIPPEIAWNPAIPTLIASNNWVVSGSRTSSGFPMMANDPHLEINRLPNVWQEIVLRRGDRYAMGATMPGLPAILIGRTRDVAWGVTYAFMDAVDSWIEHCRDGKCFREPDGWVPLNVRKEVIQRKKKPAVELTFFENEHGVLDGDPFEEGYYLATRWSAAKSGVQSINAFMEMWDAADVSRAMDLLGQVESAWNWTIADRTGNIGYQMSGLMPHRRPGVSGFIPLPGWKKENDWLGMVPPEQLPRCINPPEGFIATANNDMNRLGQARPINMPMSGYRSDRIAQLLSNSAKMDVESIRAIQYDIVSPQAQAFMKILIALLPQTPEAQILKEWDCTYRTDSSAPFLFERIYRELRQEVFGRLGLGEQVCRFLVEDTGLLNAFHGNFDRILLAEKSAWFGGENRDEIYRRAIARALDGPVQNWGVSQRMMMRNILFQGRLPRWLGFDRGPVVVPGGRATIHQAQFIRAGGRSTSFAPSIRMIADMADDLLHTNLCGGPSDRRFSRWYCSDLPNWIEGKYKPLRA